MYRSDSSYLSYLPSGEDRWSLKAGTRRFL
jgi:hypothetical protein